MIPAPELRGPVRVMVVEDSPVVREHLLFLLSMEPRLAVDAAVESGEEAIARMATHPPDVILMDIHLPGIDGYETTRKIMSTTPVPIIICSASTSFLDVNIAMRAMEAGALTALRKPAGPADPSSDAEAAAIIRTLLLMSEVKVVRRWNGGARQAPVPAPAPQPAQEFPLLPDPAVVVIGASTGGPPALLKILSALPYDYPLPLLIVQHITAGFTEGFAEWLASAARFPVRVARDGEEPRPGRAYVAPDNLHLTFGTRNELRLVEGTKQYGLRPSVGALFRSAAERFGPRAIGVLLTGMGRDGAEELKFMAERGALTVAQDEASSTVFGMPAEAIRLGAARYILPPERIAELLNASARRGNEGAHERVD